MAVVGGGGRRSHLPINLPHLKRQTTRIFHQPGDVSPQASSVSVSLPTVSADAEPPLYHVIPTAPANVDLYRGKNAKPNIQMFSLFGGNLSFHTKHSTKACRASQESYVMGISAAVQECILHYFPINVW